MPGEVIITFQPAVPCAMQLSEESRCGQPATAGLLFRMDNGIYRLLPICKECSGRWFQVYGEDRAITISIELEEPDLTDEKLQIFVEAFGEDEG